MSEYTNAPNPLSNDSTKDSIEFGLNVMKGCYAAWKKQFDKRKPRFEENRAYAAGKQPMEEFKDAIEIEGIPAQVHLDYSPIPIAIPFIKRLKDRYNQRIEKIQCNSIDPFTQSKKKTAKDNARFKMKEKQRIQEMEQMAGMPLEDFSEDDPQDEHELNLEFGFNYKEREEVIMESLIDIVFYENRWSEVIKDTILMNAITCGFSVVRVDLDANGRIKHNLLKKPEYFMSSFSQWDDFRDWEWMGQVYPMKITDIRMKYPGKLSEEQLYELAKSNASEYNNPAWNNDWGLGGNGVATPWDAFRVMVADLDYKTLHNLTYEKNRDRFGKELLDKTSKLKAGKEYEHSKPYYVSYTGVWVVDSEHLLEWGLTKSMIKPDQNLTEIHSRYAVYMHDNVDMNNTPIIETMIPSIKQMQHISLQTQKLIASMAPDGYDVDISGVSDIDMGEGVGIVTPMQLFGIYLQTGVKYYKGTDDSGEGGAQRAPIQASQTPFSTKLEQLDGQWQKEYQKLMTIVGSNNLDQGNISNQAVGKQVLADARQLGEGPTNYIYNLYLNIMTQVAKLTQLRGWDILVYGKEGYDGYRMALGEDKIEYLKLEATDDFEKTNYDVKITAVMDGEEMQQLSNDINQSLANGQITLPDAIDCRRLAKTSLKYASYMLASRIKKRERQKEEQALRNNQMSMEANSQAAQVKAEGEERVLILKHKLELEMQKEKLEVAKEMEIMKFSGILKAKIVAGVLAQEGKTVKDIPEFVFEGLDIVAKTEKQIMAEAIMEMGQQAEQEQLEQQQMAEQQPMQEQQDMEQEQPQEAEMQ